MITHTGAFSLDGPSVERRPLTPRESLSLSLPLPPPGHDLFVEVPGLGRAPTRTHTKWRRDAWSALIAKPRRFIGGPVRIAIVLADKGRGDLEARAKAVVDFLVLRNVIEDDTRRVVRELNLSWGPVGACEVTVAPISAETAAR